MAVRPLVLERMLRVYFLQQWYGLADEALEDALYDSQALQGFARIDLTNRQTHTVTPKTWAAEQAQLKKDAPKLAS